MGKLKTITNRWYEIIVPLCHFLISFLWENKIFKYGNLEGILSLVRNEQVISIEAELRIVYVLSRIFCLVFICVFWKIVFFVIKEKPAKKDIIILGSILFIGFLCGLIMYPDSLGIGIDNYCNFMAARRFQPTYWQNIYTGAVYGGCLMLIPHPFSLFVVQWSFFWSVISYIYIGIGDKCPNKLYKYFVLVVFLFPESYFLTFNPYRNNYYAVLILFYIAFLYFLFKNREGFISIKKLIVFSLITALIMGWRSEGLLLGLAGLLIYTIGLIRFSNKKLRIALLLIVSFATFLVLNQIQSLGAKKYYGQDYMILNTTNVLSSIFNDPQANLSYEGAIDDLNAIEAVVPKEVLREAGMRGYRDYNWTEGRADFNQSLATDEESSAYMSAYYRIILHNVKTYLGVQLNSFLSAINLRPVFTVYSYNSAPQVQLKSFVYDGWKHGAEEVYQTWNTKAWANNKFRVTVGTSLKEFIYKWRIFIFDSGIGPIIQISFTALLAVFFVLEFVNSMKIKRFVNSLPFCVAFLAVLGELAAIILFMPEGRSEYLYPVQYASYFLVYLYCIESYKGKGTEK